jgi:VIT1/CCC1 family predicted Fe2+/Mn2+ transporter
VGFLLIILLAIFANGTLVQDEGFHWIVLFFAGMVGLSYGTLSSTITTSPEGIECVSFGIRVRATWDRVERIDINPYGFVNLFFKESLYKNEFINALFRPLAYDRTIQLSPYIDDVASSNLLKDIAKYVPNSNVPVFLAQNKRSRKKYQKVGAIGLYYLGVLILMVPFAFALGGGARYLEASGFQNATLIFYFMNWSLIISLVLGAMNLLGYNAETANLKERKLARRARTFYLAPIVTLLLSLVVGMGIWTVLQFRSITVEEDADFALVAIFLGIASLRISSVVEGLIFEK